MSGDQVAKTLKTRISLPVGEPIRIDMAITADSRMSIKYNDQDVTEGYQLPPGKPIIPIIQAVLIANDAKNETKNERAIVDVSLLSISGLLPEGK